MPRAIWSTSKTKSGDRLGVDVVTVRRVETGQRLVALTFDDGPDAALTPAKVRALAEVGAAATFFTLGRLTDELPAVARGIVATGGEVGNHSYSHPYLTALDPGRIIAELEQAKRAIRQATRTFVPLFRPPYGDHDAKVLAAAGDDGYRFNVLWDVDPSDYQRPPAEAIADRVLTGVGPGSIVVLHDWVPETAEALPGILSALRHRGFSVVTVTDLLAAADPDRPPG